MKKIIKSIIICIIMLIPFLSSAEKSTSKPVCTTVIVDIGFGVLPIYEVITECTDGTTTITIVKIQWGKDPS
jgi:hypothetical protein